MLDVNEGTDKNSKDSRNAFPMRYIREKLGIINMTTIKTTSSSSLCQFHTCGPTFA
jgi:hypothetical protein